MEKTQLTPQGKTELTPAQQNITAFKKKLDGNYVQNQLKAVLKENSGTFATSLMEVYTNDKQLQECDQNAVIQEAIKAASLKLPLNKQLGYGYIVVYKNNVSVYNPTTKNYEWKKVPTPTLVIGYKGYIQLAMRTGQYRNINADVVYEGELRGTDKLTGAIDINGQKTSDRVVGYFAHFELINGFTKTNYVSIDEMAAFALKYVPAFKSKQKDKQGKELPPPTVDTLIDMAQEHAQNGAVQGTVGWKGDFNAMAEKTVLRHLLSKYGLLSIEMMNALSVDGDARIEDADAEEIRDNELAAPRQTVSADNLIQNADAVEIKEQKTEQPPI